MGCATSLAQVGPVEDPQSITHNNPIHQRMKLSLPQQPCQIITFLKVEISQILRKIAQIFYMSSRISLNQSNISISPSPFLATPD
jgi:hypothetical protein